MILIMLVAVVTASAFLLGRLAKIDEYEQRIVDERRFTVEIFYELVEDVGLNNVRHALEHYGHTHGA